MRHAANASVNVRLGPVTRPAALLEHPIARPAFRNTNYSMSVGYVVGLAPKDKVVSRVKAGVISRVHMKPGKRFFITVKFEHKLSYIDKTMFLQTVTIPHNEIISFCITSELCEKSETGVAHLHCFLEFENLLLSEEIC